MDAIFQLYESILQLFVALWDIFYSLAVLLLQYAPLIAWVAYWLLAVNWVKFREVLAGGGWIGVVLIGFIMVLIWGLVAPPEREEPERRGDAVDVSCESAGSVAHASAVDAHRAVLGCVGGAERRRG